MKILKFHIVGLTHNDVKNCEVQYAKEAVGKTLCLVPDDANPFDLLAVKAYEGQKSIGFVSALEAEDVRAAIIASGDSSLRTRCVACDSKEENGKTGLYLEVKALVDATDEEIEQARIKIYDDRMYEDWRYTGPIYTIDKLVRFSDSTLMLEGVINRIIKIQKQLAGKDAGVNGLNGALAGKDAEENGQAEEQDGEMMAMLQEELDKDLQEARERLVAFLENQRSDYSREMTQARNRLLKKLGQIKDDELQKLRAVLLTEMGFITSSKYRESAAKSFFIDTPMTIKGKPNGAYDYEDQIDEIERQLGAFPFNLYRVFKADPVDFLRQVFYKRVPRKMMIPLLSGIILMIKSGRVNDVKQWGKHGDAASLEAMKAMKAVGAKPSNEVKKEKFMELVDLVIPKIAVYKKNGCPELLVKKQSDWFPVFRLLNGWGLFDMGAPTAFCKHLAHLYEKLPPENTERAPLCKWKDLAQVKSAPFEYAALEWWKLDSGGLGSISLERFNRYCDIVNAFKKILGETACSENVNLREIMPKLVDKKVPTSNTMKDDEMMARDGS